MTTTGPDTERWLRRYGTPRRPTHGAPEHRRGALRARLVCFPHAGGSASFFRSFTDHAPEDVELVAMQYPGHEDRLREPCMTGVEDLADTAAHVLARDLRDRGTGPALHLFGHSLGAWVAYEVARRLEGIHQVDVAALHVSAAAAPTAAARPAGGAATSDTAVWARVGELGGVPSSVLEDEDLRDLLLPVLRADFAVTADYRHVPGPPLRCPVAVYAGTQDPACIPEDLPAWAQTTVGPFSAHTWPGGHFYLLPHAAAVVQRVLDPR